MTLWKSARAPMAFTSVLISQMAHAAYRDDLPTLPDQDPTGNFGSDELPQLRFVFLGDSSITAPGVKPLDHSWPRQLAIHLSDRYNVELRSVARGGARIQDVLTTQIDEAMELDPDIVYVSIGSNDALRATSIRRFEESYDRMVSRLHEAVPAVGLSGVGDLGTVPRIPQLASGIVRVRSRAINNAIARVSARYPRTVKSNAWTVMKARFNNDPSMFGEDMFHVSAKGHKLFGEIAAPVADRLVEIWETQDDSPIALGRGNA